MKGIAFFVEGDTEYDFILQLLLKSKYCTFGEPKKVKGVCIMESTDNRYRIRICNAGSDSRVKDELWDSQDKLQESGYTMFLCLRDLRGAWKKGSPKTINDVVKIKNTDNKILKLNDDNLSIYSILAVMEIETWFIAETSHYERIDPRLTRQFIETKTDETKEKVNPYKCSPKKIVHPYETLKDIYNLVGLTYEKDPRHRRRTINALDYSFLTKDVAAKIEQDLQPELSAKSKLEPYYNDKFGSLLTLVNALDKFFGKSTTL